MNITDVWLSAAVALICAAIAQFTSGYSKGGWLVNLIVGFLGALAGVFFSRLLNAVELYNLEIGIRKFPVLYAVIGAVLALAAISLVVKPGRR